MHAVTTSLLLSSFFFISGQSLLLLLRLSFRHTPFPLQIPCPSSSTSPSLLLYFIAALAAAAACQRYKQLSEQEKSNNHHVVIVEIIINNLHIMVWWQWRISALELLRPWGLVVVVVVSHPWLFSLDLDLQTFSYMICDWFDWFGRECISFEEEGAPYKYVLQ